MRSNIEIKLVTWIGLVTTMLVAWLSIRQLSKQVEQKKNSALERQEITERFNPTPTDIAKYIETHNGSTPPDSWFPNGSPYKSFTAEEADEWLKHCEDTPENRKKWANAGISMKP